MKYIAAVFVVVVLGGGLLMGAGVSSEQAAATAGAGGGGCVLPPGYGLPSSPPWPDTLEPVHVAQVAAAAGWSGENLVLAVAVAKAESGHRPSATNQNTDRHRSVDYGLWQVNGYYHPEKLGSGDWKSPWDNARMAKAVWDASGWRAWATYKNNLHTKFMAEARKAVAQLDGLSKNAGGCTPTPAGGTGNCAAVTGPVQAAATAPVKHARGTTTVHKCLVGNVAALFAAAHKAGLPLAGGGYRDPAGQLRVRRNNCGTSSYAIYQAPSSSCSPPTARPGTSMHERGLAIDFTCGHPSRSVRLGDQCSRWLLANSERFGLKNWPVESWHFSTTGS